MANFEMSRIDLRNRTLSAAQLRSALPRGGVDVDAVLPKVRPIVDAVAARGAEAALEYGDAFDGVRPAAVRVPAAALEQALRTLDPAVRAALKWPSSGPAPSTRISVAPAPPRHWRPGPP